MIPKDIQDIVADLNENIVDAETEYQHCFYFATDGNIAYIKFDQVVLWRSDEDDRDFDEQQNEYEGLFEYIKKKYNKYCDELNKLKFTIR